MAVGQRTVEPHGRLLAKEEDVQLLVARRLGSLPTFASQPAVPRRVVHGAQHTRQHDAKRWQ